MSADESEALVIALGMRVVRAADLGCGVVLPDRGLVIVDEHPTEREWEELVNLALRAVTEPA